MLTTRLHGDVLELHATTRLSRAVGYGVSAFRVRDWLIDTLFPRVGGELERWLGDQPRLDGVVLTHAHEDHAGNIAALVRRGARVDASDDTMALVSAPEPIALYRRATWGSPAPLRAPATRSRNPSLERLPAPGHAADHHVVWDRETGTVFGGDLFIGVRVRIAHAEEDHRALIDSLRRVAALQPARYFDAHRGLLRDPVPLLLAKADWLEETVVAIETRIRNGETDDAIRRIVLGREDLTGVTSRGEYSRLSMVRAIRNRMQQPPASEAGRFAHHSTARARRHPSP
jgi:glyoxylase-like metal-dependent hydrolase (beta-lactamase superfamily II)